MTNPFTLYPQVPGSTAHPERPWWYRMVIHTDVLKTIHRVQGELYHWSRWPDGKLIKDRRWRECPTISGYYIGEHFDMRQLGAGELEEMDRLDRLDPLPAPPLVPGQVWALPWSNNAWKLKPINGLVVCADTELEDYDKNTELVIDSIEKDRALLVWGPNNQRWAPPGWTEWALC